jgi:F0F1-type ATP synthase gamma subunit
VVSRSISDKQEVIGAINRASNERLEKSSSRLTEYRQYMDKQKQLLQQLNYNNQV